MSLDMQVVGMRETLQALRNVPRDVQNKHVRIGMNKGGGMIKATAVSFATVETGLLKKSLAVKVKVPDASFNVAHHGRPAYAVVGPGRNKGRMMRMTSGGKLRGHGKAQKQFLEEVKIAKGEGARGRDIQRAARNVTGGKFADATYRNPTRYAHIVERGSKRVRARPFLSIAARITGPAAQQAVIQKVQEGLRQEAQKAYARSLTARR